MYPCRPAPDAGQFMVNLERLIWFSGINIHSEAPAMVCSGPVTAPSAVQVRKDIVVGGAHIGLGRAHRNDGVAK